MLNTYLSMECASSAQHKVCWAHRSPVSSVFLARPCMAGSLWPNSRLGESYHCPLCPQACLREIKDPSGAAHRQAGPQAENPRSETASHTEGAHSTGSHRVWSLGQNQEQGGPSGGLGWQLQAERGEAVQLPGSWLGWAGRAQPPLSVSLCSL